MMSNGEKRELIELIDRGQTMKARAMLARMQSDDQTRASVTCANCGAHWPIAVGAPIQQFKSCPECAIKELATGYASTL